MSSLLLLSVYVHVIYILSGIYVLRAHYLKWSLISSFLTDNDQCHPYIISSTLYIVAIMYNLVLHIVYTDCTLSMDHLHVVCTCTHHLLVIFNTPHIPYYPQLSFRTLTTHMHIVHVICMLSAHVHIICLSSLTLLMYPIIHNLVSIHIVSINAHCQYHLYIVCRCICYVHVLISTASYLYMYMIIRIIHLSICVLVRTLSCSGPWYIPSWDRQCRCHPYVISSTLYMILSCTT